MFKRRMILAWIAGGGVLFLWGFLTHAVLPFYNNSLNRFTNEDEIQRAIAAGATKSGTYLVPNIPLLPENAPPGEKEAALKVMQDKMAKGPTMYAHLRVGEVTSYAGYFLVQILTDFVAAFILAFVLWNSKSAALASRITVAAAIGIIVIVLQSVPQWNWYAAGTDHIVAEAIDLIVGLPIAGFVISKLMPSEGSAAA